MILNCDIKTVLVSFEVLINLNSFVNRMSKGCLYSRQRVNKKEMCLKQNNLLRNRTVQPSLSRFSNVPLSVFRINYIVHHLELKAMSFENGSSNLIIKNQFQALIDY